MSTKNNPGEFDCYAKAEPDEPMFVLLARDPLAPILVRLWADMTGSKKQGKIREALECAADMVDWKRARDGADKAPDQHAA